MTRRRTIWREFATDAGLAGPATMAMLVLIFGPALIVLILSFTDYQFGARSFNWLGLKNYQELFTDPIGRKAVVNTLIYVAVVMPTSMLLALLVALGVHSVARWSGRTAKILRVAYFMPVVATLVAMATVWQMLLHPNLGCSIKFFQHLTFQHMLGCQTGRWFCIPLPQSEFGKLLVII